MNALAGLAILWTIVTVILNLTHVTALPWLLVLLPGIIGGALIALGLLIVLGVFLLGLWATKN